jgi:hypothetical protein
MAAHLPGLAARLHNKKCQENNATSYSFVWVKINDVEARSIIFFNYGFLFYDCSLIGKNFCITKVNKQVVNFKPN